MRGWDFWPRTGGATCPARGGLLSGLPSVVRHGISGSSGWGDELFTFGSIVVLMVLLGLMLYLGRGRKKDDK